MDIFDQLLGDVELPKFYKVKQNFDRPRITDLEAEVRNSILGHGGLDLIKPGHTIAITAGSRGIANIALIVKEVVKLVKKKAENLL